MEIQLELFTESRQYVVIDSQSSPFLDAVVSYGAPS